MADDAVKTVAGEITKIAVEHGYDGAAPKTITGAIDALADTLAGSDVDSGQTVAQAVRALAPYIGSGGGGSLGELQMMPMLANAPVEVGMDAELMGIGIYELYVGSQIVLNSADDTAYVSGGVAAGTTVVMQLGDEEVEGTSVFLVTFDDDDGSFSTVEAFDLDVSIDVEHGTASWVMPVWNATEGQTPVIYFDMVV